MTGLRRCQDTATPSQVSHLARHREQTTAKILQSTKDSWSKFLAYLHWPLVLTLLCVADGSGFTIISKRRSDIRRSSHPCSSVFLFFTVLPQANLFPSRLDRRWVRQIKCYDVVTHAHVPQASLFPLRLDRRRVRQTKRYDVVTRYAHVG